MADPVEPRTEAEWPTTAAGGRLFTDNEPMDMFESDGVTWEDVRDIEREAVNAERTRWEPLLDAARAIARKPEIGEGPYSYVRTDEIADLHAAVRLLATLDAARAATPAAPEWAEDLHPDSLGLLTRDEKAEVIAMARRGWAATPAAPEARKPLAQRLAENPSLHPATPAAPEALRLEDNHEA